MADFPLTPDERPANTSCAYPDWGLLAQPHQALPVPKRLPDPDGWHFALTRYRLAEGAYETFIEQNYRPPYGEVAGRLDEIAAKLLADRLEQAMLLTEAPAPSWTALLAKMEIVHRDVFLEIPDLEPIVAELVGDFRRLCVVQAALDENARNSTLGR